MSRPSLGALPAVALVLAHTIAMAADNPADIAFEEQFGEAFFDRVWQLNPDGAKLER